MSHALIVGHGYAGQAIAALLAAAGWQVTATRRRPGGAAADGVRLLAFDQAGTAMAGITHLVCTAAPDAGGDPALAAHGAAIARAPALRWIGYMSTTGVYGDRQGGWVDEATAPAPISPRAHRRVAAEQQWAALADGRAVDVMRLAGIYGPGRSVFDELRAGTARRIVAENHLFGRIHRDDIAGGAVAAMAREAPGLRVLNFSDDEPAASADVVAEAARLLGMAPPAARPLAEAWAAMSEMGRSFWAENRRVSSARTQAMLGRAWRYPTYREGLRAILAAEGGGGQ